MILTNLKNSPSNKYSVELSIIEKDWIERKKLNPIFISQMILNSCMEGFHWSVTTGLYIL